MNSRLDFSTVELVGRDEEVKSLKRCFRRVAVAASSGDASPTAEIVLVSGPSGCGKSSLVDFALNDECTARGGWMVTGKFERGARISSNGLDEAFSNLMQLVWESENGNEFREEVLKQIGGEYQILAERIPALDAIFKETELSNEKKDLKRTEDNEYAIERLKMLYRVLLRSVQCSCKRPIVFFLDDIQFIDEDQSNVLDLIEFLSCDADATSCLFAMSYRNDEVGESVSDMLKRIETYPHAQVTCIEVTCLKSEEIAFMLQRLTKVSDEVKLAPLSELVYQRTGGNPMFVREFIKSLEQQELLYYSMKSFQYDWDLESIKKLTQVTVNVRDFIASKIDALPNDVIKTLKIAACLGFFFQVRACELSSSIGGQKIDIKQNLELAFEMGLIEPLDGDGGHWYKFAHDSINEAIISLMKDTEELEGIYWRDGLALKHLMDSGVNSADSLIASVFLLNKGRSLAGTGGLDQIPLALLNMQASRIAKSKSAFQVAFNFAETGISLLPEDSRWRDHYDSMLAFSMLLIETSLCFGKNDASYAAIAAIEENATTLDDKLAMFHYHLGLLASEGKLIEAMSFGLKTLKKLGKRLPEHPSSLRLYLEMRKVKKAMSCRSDDEILKPPADATLRDKTVVRLLDNLTGVAFLLGRDKLFAFVTIQALEANLRMGVFTGYPFALIGAALIALGDTQGGTRCGNLALKSLKITPEETHCKTVSNTAIFVSHWSKPLQDTMSLQLQAYKSGMKTGDMYFAAVAATCYCEVFFFSGLPLNNLDRDAGSYVDILTQYKQYSVTAMLRLNYQAVQNLLGKKEEDPLDMSGKVVSASMLRDAPEMVARYANQYIVILSVYFNRFDVTSEEALEAYYFGSMSIDGHYFSTIFRFYLALTFLRKARLSKTKSQHYVKRGKSLMKIIEKQVRQGNGNLQHMLSICQAELGVTIGKPQGEVKSLFGKAIALSTRSGFVNQSALCNEALARFLLSQNEQDDANHYLRRALSLYKDWNASRLVDDLVQEFPSLALADSMKESSKSYLGRSRFQSVHKETFSGVKNILQLDPELETKANWI